MKTETLITELLNKNWSDDCELAGRATVHNIVHAVNSGATADFRRAPGLANWDSASIKTIVEIATFLKTSIDIWIALHKLHGRRPTREEFVASASQQITIVVPGVKDAAEVYTLLEPSM